MSQDQVIVCKECHAEFVWTEGEQKFYEDKGFTPPQRCKDCRQKKREQREKKQTARR